MTQKYTHTPSYNSNKYSKHKINSPIENPADNIKTVYFDGGEREPSFGNGQFKSEQLKKMGNRSTKIYIFKSLSPNRYEIVLDTFEEDVAFRRRMTDYIRKNINTLTIQLNLMRDLIKN